MNERKKILERMYVDPFFFAKVLFGDKKNPMHYHLRCESPQFHREISNIIKKFTSILAIVWGQRGVKKKKR